MQHRIKTIFSALGGMARLSARDATSMTKASNGFKGRFAAMTGAYAHVIAPEGPDAADRHGEVALRYGALARKPYDGAL